MYSFVDNPVAAVPSKTQTSGEASGLLVGAGQAPHLEEVVEHGSPSEVSVATAALSLPPGGSAELLLLALHDAGVSSADIGHFKKDIREAIRLIRRHWFWELAVAVHTEFIDWKSLLIPQQTALFKECGASFGTGVEDTPIPFIATDAADILTFLSPAHAEPFMGAVAEHLNSIVTAIKGREDGKYANANVIVIAHGLGGIIMYELLTGGAVASRPTRLPAEGSSEEGPHLTFPVHSLFLAGCPLAAFLALYGEKKPPAPSTGRKADGLILPSGVRVYNIMHPADKYATRVEPSYYDSTTLPPPVLLPYWRDNAQRTRRGPLASSPTSRLQQLSQTATSRVLNFFGSAPKEGETQPDQAMSPPEVGGPVRLVLRADVRYGTHDRRPITPMMGASVKTFRSLRTARRIQRPTSLKKLFDILGIDERNRTTLRTTMEIPTDDLPEVTLGPRTAPTDADIFSESETGPGLELPVRLDFQLPTTAEDAAGRASAIAVGATPKFNYWKSYDLCLFILKQATCFRPRIPYPDFVRAVEFSEKRGTARPTTGSMRASSTAHEEAGSQQQQQQPRRLHSLHPPVKRRSTDENVTASIDAPV